MSNGKFVIWSWITGVAFTFVLSGAIFLEQKVLTYTWDGKTFHRHGFVIGHAPDSPASFWFHLLWSILIVGIAPILLALIWAGWDEEARLPWWRDRAERVQRSRASKEIVRHDRDRDKDKARLRKLALIAAENDVYDSIKEGRKVNDTTAALLRQAELDS